MQLCRSSSSHFQGPWRGTTIYQKNWKKKYFNSVNATEVLLYGLLQKLVLAWYSNSRLPV
jgi:hypothetical protein